MIYGTNTICIIYTYKCNLECEHCCFECSPKKQEKLSFERVIELIKEAESLSYINNITFTGGEIFLYFDDLIEFAALCKKCNLNLTCVTNGYFGLNYEDAYKKMQLLKRNGLHNLIVSYDEFHNKFLDVNAIKNLIRICNILGINIEIKSVILNNDYKKIDFKEDVLGIPVRKIKCIRIGRAAKINSELFRREEQIYNYRCSSIVHEIAVYPNGNVFPCCSPGCMNNSKFLLGNINSNTLEECLKNIEKNKTVRDIYKYGLKDNSNEKKDIYDLCEICKYM